MTDARAPLLEMSDISKSFPGVRALSSVSLSLEAGEVLALMGENGAGKSTLMKILGGAYVPDTGVIRLAGREVALSSVRAAKDAGIALIHQELMLAGNLDIAANIFLGNEPGSASLLRPVERMSLKARAQALLKRVGLELPASTLVSRLTAGQMQMVEIAKSLALNARVIIMDEPTSSLTAGESQQLFQIIRQLKFEGIGIVYISHRMEEVLALADRITVLRDGRNVGDLAGANATHEKIVGMMVGRELSSHYFPERPASIDGEVELEVENLLVPGAPSGVSFNAHRGEILGFAGLVGAGRTELMQTLFGVTPARGGSMRLGGLPFAPSSPREAIARGVYLAPEDRKRHGLVLPMSVAENTSLPNIASYARLGWLNRKREREVAAAEVARLRTRTAGIHQRVLNLSGGNQQKVVLGKWLAMTPRVLILDEPTRGIDVGAKAEIYRQMAELAASGMTILMVSSDMEEIMGISDRVLVMHERRLRGSLVRAAFSERRIANLMTGKRAESEQAA